MENIIFRPWVAAPRRGRTLTAQEGVGGLQARPVTIADPFLAPGGSGSYDLARVVNAQ
jgi:hypothetical protein